MGLFTNTVIHRTLASTPSATATTLSNSSICVRDAPAAPAEPVIGRATHAADLDLDTPTPLMLSCIFQFVGIAGTSHMTRMVAGNSSTCLWSPKPNDSVSVVRPVIGARTVAREQTRIRKAGSGRQRRPVAVET